MANPEHLEILKRGVEAWNEWRQKNAGVKPNLSGASLTDIDDLTGVNFRRANLERADLSFLDLPFASLRRAHLTNATLQHSVLNDADLSYAVLDGANFMDANLTNVRCYRTDIRGAIFRSTDLRGASFRKVKLGYTIFSDIDLSAIAAFEPYVHPQYGSYGWSPHDHWGPSSVDIATLYRSNGNISDDFLRDCGVPEDFITYARSLVIKAIEFYSCFISYSSKDEEFARRLFSRMRDANLRVWYAPEEMKGGRKLHEQIFSAIQLYDKLLLILSEDSLQSEWVMTEIRRARKAERQGNRRKLFPIRLVGFDVLQKWECFDADSGKDLATEVREYYIPDFSDWKDHDAFEKAFDRLLRDLKAEEK